jgi:hypothetical protein
VYEPLKLPSLHVRVSLTGAVPHATAALAYAVTLLPWATGAPPQGEAHDSFVREQFAVVPPFNPLQFHVYDVAPLTLFTDVPAVQLYSVAAQEPFITGLFSVQFAVLYKSLFSHVQYSSEPS